MKTFVARTADRWREWLDGHHDSESEVWLIFHKQHTGLASIAYEDAVDEALCFGWVDILIKRLDDSRYARKFTPRKAWHLHTGEGTSAGLIPRSKTKQRRDV